MPEIIDTHVHIWNFEKAEYAWLKNDTSILNRSYHLEELQPARAAAGITGGVLVQAANNPEDTDWMLEVAAQQEWIKGVVGWLPLTDRDSFAPALQKYLRNPYFKGVRHLIHDEADPRWLLQDAVIENLQILSASDVPYDVVGVNTEHIRTALAVAQQVPQLRMIFDHCNQPPIATGERFGEWGELMKEAAKHKNFYMKISGLGTTARKGAEWTARDLEPYIGFVLEQFGGDRCCWGGDWPVSLLAGDYKRSWEQYAMVFDKLLNAEGKEMVLYSNAKTFYKL